MEIFGFAREMSGQTTQLVGQMQAQAQVYQDQSQNQINQILAQAEAQRQDAKLREEAQRLEAQNLRAEAIRREEMYLAREQMMAKMNADTKQALRKEKADADERGSDDFLA